MHHILTTWPPLLAENHLDFGVELCPQRRPEMAVRVTVTP
jgi:hypothetical protein